jgi:hypothetical protein
MGHLWRGHYRIRDLVVCHVMRLGATTDALVGSAFARGPEPNPLVGLDLLIWESRCHRK